MNKMIRILPAALFPAALFVALSGLTITPTATAQEAVLAEIYGRGVHAFYSGQHDQARQMFSSAINNGIKDPRAYYFRGIVSSMQGRSFEAESDWKQGAMLEAQAGSNPAVGRSLARFQGSARLKLEQIRQTARLQALSLAASRSNFRTNEIQAAQPGFSAGSGTRTPPPPAIVGSSTRSPLPGASPAPVPPVADDDPFKDDSTSMASGKPEIESDDALKGADSNPFGKDDAMGAPVAAGGGDPFSGGGDAAGADPFGGGDGGGADPFGGAGGAADPFGGSGDDPFN